MPTTCVFDSRKWQRAQGGMRDQLVSAIRDAALSVASALPPGEPTQTDLPAAADHLCKLAEHLRTAREQLGDSDAIPRRGATQVELAIWAIGFAHHVSIT